MKNYIVKATKYFTDYEGLETIPTNPHIERKINDIFYCTKERYVYLKQNNAVILQGINKQEKKVKNNGTTKDLC